MNTSSDATSTALDPSGPLVMVLGPADEVPGDAAAEEVGSEVAGGRVDDAPQPIATTKMMPCDTIRNYAVVTSE